MTERTYRLISGDSHVNEPGDLWTARVPREFRDRAPRIDRFEQGDAWVLEGVRDPINFGMNACAGLDPADMHAWSRFDDMRAGGYDPAARIAEMDRDGVDAEVLYPTPRLAQGVVATKEMEFHLALVRAYNDWLSEYARHAPDRFAGLMLLPNRGAESAVAEIERVAGRPGIRGVMMGCYPNGTLEVADEDDAVWSRLVEAGLPLNIHVSLSQHMPAAHRAALPGYGRFFDAPNRIVQMIFAGVFDRFPTLDVVVAEVDCGWVPYFKEQIDNNYRRLDAISDFHITALPSEYVERHLHFTYLTDPFGIANRHAVGTERILWSSDYPHISSDWPHSWDAIEATFAGVDAGEREAILHGNAERLYGFGN
jgi:predicted TIM-barrel fold metal-dependent hydrolase